MPYADQIPPSPLSDDALSALVARYTRDAVIVTDAEGRIQWANAAFVQISGYGLGEVMGRKPGSFLQGPETDPDAIAAMRAAQQQQVSCRVEILNYAKNGRPYWLDIEISPVLDEDGALQHFVAVERDVTDIRMAERDKRDLSAYQEALNQHAIVSVASRSGEITFVNDNFCDISGYARHELIGANHRLVNSGTHPRAFFDEMWRTIASGKPWRAEVCNRRRSGDTYWVDTTIVPVCGAEGRPERYVSIRYDISERKAAETELRRMAETDALTQLSNRKVLLDRLKHAIDGGRRADAEGGALLLLDMDHFKDVNDTLGHDVGDKILCEIGARLRKAARAGDTVARLGGDEFAIILPGVVDDADCGHVLRRLYGILTAPIAASGESIAPSFSIGVSHYPKDSRDPIALLKQADIALYEVKRNGRGHWRYFDPQDGRKLNHRITLVNAMREAIAADAFDIALQPQVDLATGALRGFEALARWPRDGAPTGPQEFIPIAEESGLIRPLGRQILQRSLRAARKLRDEGFQPGLISVNVSAPEFVASDYRDAVMRSLDQAGLSPEMLELELTETALMGRSAKAVLDTLQDLFEDGVKLALDDFGTGYSSLTHLSQIPATTLKIDRSFVQKIDSPGGAALVAGVVDLSQRIGLQVVAEGVETACQMAKLRAMRSEFGQGYLFGRPMTMANARAFLSALADDAAGHAAG